MPVHKRSPSSTSSSLVSQTPVSDVYDRRKFDSFDVNRDLRRALIRSPETPVPVYAIAELLQLYKSPLVQTSLTSEQKQGIADVMAYVPQPQQRTKIRSPSPSKSSRSPSPTTQSKRASSPTKKAKKSPAPETVSVPNVDTPPSPRHGPSKRRLIETDTNMHSYSGLQHHRRRQWGYAPSFHHNEDNWRAHSSVAVAA